MRSSKLPAMFAILFLATFSSVRAQSQNPPDQAVAANAAYQAKDWTRAKSLYSELVQSQPDSYLNWFRLGVSAQALGQHDVALDALQKAKVKGLPISIVGFNIAAVLASMGQTEKAMDQLTDAVKQGYNQPDQMNNDPDLQSVRKDARFAPLLEQAKRNQTPCDYKVENRQFDFWVGDWDVSTTQAGSPAGISHIERAIGNCVIWENWTSLGNTGYSGKSYNIYNADFKRWEQFWVDNLGGVIHFYGGLKDGVMDFFTEDVPQSDGTKLKRHLQFFSIGPDRVRQFSQGSSDGGITWSIEYDLTYNRKK
jgi:tetratricopeptide (TPR) repeat protein